MARRRFNRSRALFPDPAARFAVVDGQTVISESTRHAALKTAVKQVRRFGNVVQVIEQDRSKKRGARSFHSVAMCMPKWKTIDELEAWRRAKKKPVQCRVSR